MVTFRTPLRHHWDTTEKHVFLCPNPYPILMEKSKSVKTRVFHEKQQKSPNLALFLKMSPTDLILEKCLKPPLFSEFSTFSCQNPFSLSGLLASPVQSCPIDVQNPTKPGKCRKTAVLTVRTGKTPQNSCFDCPDRENTQICSESPLRPDPQPKLQWIPTETVPGPIPRCTTRVRTTHAPGYHHTGHHTTGHHCTGPGVRIATVEGFARLLLETMTVPKYHFWSDSWNPKNPLLDTFLTFRHFSDISANLHGGFLRHFGQKCHILVVFGQKCHILVVFGQNA